MKNSNYEDRIYDEILVDCKDDYEQNMSWLYYLQDELQFPFEGTIKIRRLTGGIVLKKVKAIDLSKVSSSFDKIFDIKVDVELDDYIIEIPISNLEDVDSDENTIEIIEIWKYWLKR